MVAPHWISGSRLYFWRMIFPKMECQLHKLSGKPALHGESTLVMSDFFKENLPTFSWLTRVWIKTRSTSTILHLFGSEHFIALYSCNRCSVYIYIHTILLPYQYIPLRSIISTYNLYTYIDIISFHCIPLYPITCTILFMVQPHFGLHQTTYPCLFQARAREFLRPQLCSECRIFFDPRPSATYIHILL